jgi:23S rRNA pseudouridine1911/1915/1917 synthase
VSADALRVVVGPPLAEMRVDQALATALPLSRRKARALLAAGGVRRNGELLRVQGKQLALGDVLDVEPPADADVAALRGAAEAAVPASVSLLLDDGWLLAVDKPSGVLSQPAEQRAAGELAMDELLLLRRAWESGRRPFVRLVHRLDRVTSGVLLFAAREAATAPLARAWREGRVERGYLALVEGEVPWESREVDAPIARDPSSAWRFVVAPHGDPAVTSVVRRASARGVTLVQCRLQTGRTHQVRVHLAHVGFPVLGDRLYGGTGDAPRPMLHAAWLALPHPRNGAPTRIEAPLPADFVALLP